MFCHLSMLAFSLNCAGVSDVPEATFLCMSLLQFSANRLSA